MTAVKGGASAAKPLFLQGSAGRIFAIYHPPDHGKISGKSILYLPPFAEEMNRSRRMVALQARALARLGYGVLLLDPYGTGDSEGEFREARVPTWLSDVDLACNWLIDAGHAHVELWGLRFGALLAAAAIERSPQRFRRLLLWQPVVNGRHMMTQFMRIALTSSWGSNEPKVTADTIRAKLSNGVEVEVGGYELSPELVTAVESMSFSPSVPANVESLCWFEVGPDPSEELMPSSRNTVDHWRDMGCDFVSRKLLGPQFWTTAETTIAPSLLDATTSALSPS